MKAHLLYPDADFAWAAPLGPNAEDLVTDLEFSVLFAAMAGGDAIIEESARRVLLTSLTDLEHIAYRQQILADCIANPEMVREMYAIATEAMARERRVWSFMRSSPASMLRRAVEVLGIFVEELTRLRALADANRDRVRSEGMTTLFATVQNQLDDQFFSAVDEHLARLRFRDGVLMSAELGAGNRGARYVLRTPGLKKRAWKERIGLGPRSTLSFDIAPRDEAGLDALGRLHDRGITLVAQALTRSTEHIKAFFSMLRAELAFYVGSVNLSERLLAIGEPTCVPEVAPIEERRLHFSALVDVCLALRTGRRVVGNDAAGDGTTLLMVTGANSGGKSTFLRSLGVAQVMAQCGLFVGAGQFTTSACRGIFTHFIREEDEELASGRLDDELVRMSEIADRVTPGALVLFNEAFVGTNEWEGSEIARQVISALLESDIRVAFVTHLYDLARSFYDQGGIPSLFLRAQRPENGHRSYKLVAGEPLSTSFGKELFQELGGWTGSGQAFSVIEAAR